MGRKVVTFDKFDGGEFSRLGAWNAPKNSFTATNMMVYRTGELGVRPGLKNISPSGLSTGLVHGFGFVGVPSNEGWFVQGTAVRTFSLGSANNLKTAATALASTPTLPVDSAIDTNTIVIASPADKLYRLTPGTGSPGTSPTVAELTGSPGARAVGVYGDRIVAGDINGSLDYRLRFSDAANPNSWPSANFIDIGDNWGISGLYAQRQHLLITKQVGWYVLTGVPGVNPVLRKVASSEGPLTPDQSALGGEDVLWTNTIFADYPSTFNGSRATEWNYLQVVDSHVDGSAIPPTHGIAPCRTSGGYGSVLVGPANKLGLFVNGVWTKHTAGVTLSGYISRDHDLGSTLVYFCDGGGAAAAPKFYVLNLNADTPGLESGSFMRASDDTSTALTGSVTFPEWWSEDGAESHVRAVIVDFRKWNTGSATTNHFDLSVSALRRYQAGAAQASTTTSFDEAASSSSTSGTLERRVFGFGEQGRGNGFQLAFSNVRGIALQRVTVVLASEPVRV